MSVFRRINLSATAGMALRNPVAWSKNVVEGSFVASRENVLQSFNVLILLVLISL